MSSARFPHHDWADADGLPSPDPQLAATGYFHRDPDAYSDRLRDCHRTLWSKQLPDGRPFDLQQEGRGLVDRTSGLYLSSDAAVPVWERWGEVQGFLEATQEQLLADGRGSVHDLGWRLYDMGGMVLFPGYQVDRLWSINQAKGCTRSRIADRLDLTLECIRRYYADRLDLSDADAAFPAHYDGVNPLGSVLHRYRSFFDLFGSFEGYVSFWLLDDLVVRDDAGPRVNFLLPRTENGPYDFTRELALPVTSDEYFGYLVAADDFVDKRNRRMAQSVEAAELAVCPGCLHGDPRGHRRCLP